MDGRKEEGRRRIWRLPSCHWTLQCTTSIDKLSLGSESDISKCSAAILNTLRRNISASHPLNLGKTVLTDSAVQCGQTDREDGL